MRAIWGIGLGAGKSGEREAPQADAARATASSPKSKRNHFPDLISILPTMCSSLSQVPLSYHISSFPATGSDSTLLGLARRLRSTPALFRCPRCQCLSHPSAVGSPGEDESAGSNVGKFVRPRADIPWPEHSTPRMRYSIGVITGWRPDRAGIAGGLAPAAAVWLSGRCREVAGTSGPPCHLTGMSSRERKGV